MSINSEGAIKVARCNLLKFQCPRTWDSLTQTRDERVRFCEQCKESVYFCCSLNDFEKHAAAGHCVALALNGGREDIADGPGPFPTLGIPDLDGITLLKKKDSLWHALWLVPIGLPTILIVAGIRVVLFAASYRKVAAELKWLFRGGSQPY